MYHKKFPTQKFYENFYACVAYGVKAKNIEESALTRFLAISDTTVNFYKPKVSHNFFKSTRLFFEKNYLHTSKFNSLEVKGGIFRFEHVVDESLFEDPESTSTAANVEEDTTKKGDWYKDVKEEDEGDDQGKTGWGDDWDGEKEDEKSDSDDGWGDDSSDDSDDGWGDDSDDGWGDDSDDGWGDDSDDGWGDDSDDNEGWGDGSGTDSEDESEWDDDKRKVANDEADAFGDEDMDTFESFGKSTNTYTPYEPTMPILTGPFLVIENMDLAMNSIYDTLIIQNTSAALLVNNHTIVGNGGRTNWSKLGLDSTNVYCDLHDYTFNARVAKMQASFAEFHYTEKLDTNIVQGVFEYKAHINNKDLKKARYPLSLT
jgi:hypothetical protein